MSIMEDRGCQNRMLMLVIIGLLYNLMPCHFLEDVKHVISIAIKIMPQLLKCIACPLSYHFPPGPLTLLALFIHFLNVILNPCCDRMLYQVGQYSNSEASQWSCCSQFYSRKDHLEFPNAFFLIMAHSLLILMFEDCVRSMGSIMSSPTPIILKRIARPRSLIRPCFVLGRSMRNLNEGQTYFLLYYRPTIP